MVMDIVLIVLAILLTAFAMVYEQYVTKNGRSIGLGMLAGGLAATFVALLVFRHLIHLIPEHASGNHQWAHNGFVQGSLMVGAAIAVGFWIWFWDRSRYKKD
jgi:hypothetical protein